MRYIDFPLNVLVVQGFFHILSLNYLQVNLFIYMF